MQGKEDQAAICLRPRQMPKSLLETMLAKEAKTVAISAVEIT